MGVLIIRAVIFALLIQNLLNTFCSYACGCSLCGSVVPFVFELMALQLPHLMTGSLTCVHCSWGLMSLSLDFCLMWPFPVGLSRKPDAIRCSTIVPYLHYKPYSIFPTLRRIMLLLSQGNLDLFPLPYPVVIVQFRGLLLLVS